MPKMPKQKKEIQEIEETQEVEKTLEQTASTDSPVWVPAVQQTTEATTEEQTPAETTTPVVVEAKPKAKRYASIAVLANPNAKIATLTPIAQTGKKEGTLTYRKYSLFQVGLTIKEVETKFVENNWPRMKARNQLRWDIEHGFVTLEMPAVEPAKEA
jgi:hypothetical protein